MVNDKINIMVNHRVQPMNCSPGSPNTFPHVSAIFSLFKYWSCGAEKVYNSMYTATSGGSDAQTRESAQKR